MFEKIYLENVDNVSKCSIQELRVLARALGVEAPTTEDKQVLYDFIVNEVLKSPELTARSKNVSGLLKLDEINRLAIDYNLHDEEEPVKTILEFRSKSKPHAEKIISGIFFSDNNKYYLVQKGYFIEREKIELPLEFVLDNNLTDGDYVEISEEDGEKKIVCLNGKRFYGLLYDYIGFSEECKEKTERSLGQRLLDYTKTSELNIGDKIKIVCQASDTVDLTDELLKNLYEVPNSSLSAVGEFDPNGREKYISQLTNGWYVNFAGSDNETIIKKIRLFIDRLVKLNSGPTAEIVVVDDLAYLERLLNLPNSSLFADIMGKLAYYITEGLLNNVTIVLVCPEGEVYDKISIIFDDLKFNKIDLTQKKDIDRSDSYIIDGYLQVNRKGNK